MRLAHAVAAGTLIAAGIAAWPQDIEDFALPPADHSLHPIIEVPEGVAAPFLRIHVIPDAMDGFNVFLETANFRFTPQNLGTAVIANEGHAHLYVNGEKVARMYSPWHHLPGKMLRNGLNRLEVEFSANDHSVWGLAGQPIGADVLIDTLHGEDDPIVEEEVRYTLDWNWDGAAKLPDGGWEVESDLGYLVRINAGRLVTRNIELVPCHPAAGLAPQASVLQSLLAAPAWAGHSSLMPNESKISKSYREDLADPGRKFLESRTVTDPEYCQAHYLLARATQSAPGALALDVSGTWTHSGNGSAGDFRIQSPYAFGRLLALRTEAGVPVSRRSIVGGLDLTVRRSLSTMFDGIDFGDANVADRGMQVMRTLVSNTVFVIAERAAPGAAEAR